MRRRTFLAGAGLAALQLAGCGTAPQTVPDYVLTYADNQPADYPTTQGAQYFADLVRERTGGKVVIQVKADGEYGTEQEVWQQLAIGGVDFARLSLSVLTDDLPKLNVLMLPYLYRDAGHMWRVLDGDIGEEFLQAFAEGGCVGLSWYDAGARSFYSRQPIRSLADLAGKTVRVQDSPVILEMIRLLGAVPETTAYSDVYAAFQTGQIDAAENNWPAYYSMDHYREVELTGAANGTVQGNLYELDYQKHFQHIREAALPVGANRLIYESGMREIGPKEHFDSRPDKYFGEFVRYEMQPRAPELLQAAIRQEQHSREPARHGDFKEHLAALHTGLIEAEAQRIVADMKHLAAPNSPDKNHFMVEVSPYFTKLASSRDMDQLLAMLPYKSLHLSSVKDRFGIYALIDKNENRDKGICKLRASVRKQLSETKQAASPKRATARSKQHEMEV